MMKDCWGEKLSHGCTNGWSVGKSPIRAFVALLYSKIILPQDTGIRGCEKLKCTWTKSIIIIVIILSREFCRVTLIPFCSMPYNAIHQAVVASVNMIEFRS